MAPVEYEEFCSQTFESIDLKYIDKGEVQTLYPYDGTSVGVYCNADDDKGMVTINTKNPHEIGAIIYDESVEGDEGFIVAINGQIVFSGSQYVLIYSEKSPVELYLQHFHGDIDSRRLIVKTRKRLPVSV